MYPHVDDRRDDGVGVGVGVGVGCVHLFLIRGSGLDDFFPNNENNNNDNNNNDNVSIIFVCGTKINFFFETTLFVSSNRAL